MTPVIYLASPIDQGSVEYMRVHAKTALLDLGCAVFDPFGGWKVPIGGEPSPALQRGNLRLLNACDGLFAILNPKVLTIGVTLELAHAAKHRIPAVAWAPQLAPSWALSYLGVESHRYLDYAIEELVRNV